MQKKRIIYFSGLILINIISFAFGNYVNNNPIDLMSVLIRPILPTIIVVGLIALIISIFKRNKKIDPVLLAIQAILGFSILSLLYSLQKLLLQ